MAAVFICHRGSDAVLAERLANDLQSAGHSVWLDLWHISIGDQIIEKMDQGLSGSRYLVLCYSLEGTAPWMNLEWMSALSRQLNGESVKVLPVRLSGTTAPAILAGTKYADLVTDWKSGLAELLKAIK